MDVGVEISFYPLQAEPLGPIRALVARLNGEKRIRVETNSLSTQLFGDYGLIMQLLAQELGEALAGSQRAVVLLKLVGPLDGAPPQIAR